MTPPPPGGGGPEPRACGRPLRPRRPTFIGRMVADILSFIRNSVYAEEIAAQPGLLQGIDPRVKLASFLLGVASVLFVRHLSVMASLYALTLIAACFSRIPLGFFLKRVWVFVPIFTGFIAVPILFSPASPGTPLLVLWHWRDGTPFAITDNGLWIAGLLVLRVATSVSLAVLLILTTPWAHILKALRVFGVPRIFVLTLEMTYRYIFLFIDIIEAEHLAKESRTIRPASVRADRQWAASRIGHLFLRSRKMGEDVYLAMLSRGYSGEAKLYTPFRLQRRDVAALVVGASLFLLVLVLGRVL